MGGWQLLVLAVALTSQSVFSLSPILSEEFPDLPDREWIAFNEIINDATFRLPTTTRPEHYEINLTPYFETNVTGETPFSTEGTVAIRIRATEANVNEIVMHCNEINIITVSVTNTNTNVEIATPGQTYICDPVYHFLRINTNQVLQLDTDYTVRISFTGLISASMRGFYRSWYYDNTGKRWMGTTQFQPVHAREAFPCYDEPGFKAYFDITINREPDFSDTISNTPILSTNTVNGRIAETFYTTPKTSTYLLAFIVSHYEKVSSNNDTDRPFDIYARNNAENTGDWSLDIGERLLVAMENFTDFPYYEMAPYLDMKQAAIPDFSAGAMENWGLLTYREALILYDPLNSNHFYRQRVANIVSHEITHMWFGNLVTCAWWDNLWLNEGFARLYQYFLTDMVAPELGFPTRFVVEQLHTSMFSDSLDSAHALTNPNVNDPPSVSAHFSTITYAKGASIIRMTEHLLGSDTYKKGLQYYLKDRQFDVAEPHHLFDALDRAAAEDGTLTQYNGITIDKYFRSWSEKAGHPILSVSVNQRTGEMFVTQVRWERNTGESAIQGLWDIPITWTRGGDADFDDLKPSQIITAQATRIDRGTVGNEWVIFNKQQTGFYRTNYDDTNWALLTLALRGPERETIHEFNRAQIVDDLFAFARAGVMPYDKAFNILSFLKTEDAYAPWIAAISGFEFLIRRAAHDAVELARLQALIIDLSTAVVDRLGFAEIPDEPYMDGLLRMYLMTFLCNVGHEQCIAAGIANFAQWTQGNYVPANLRPWVYCNGLRYGTSNDFTYFWNQYLQEDLASEKVVMIEAAGCTTDQTSLLTFLNAVIAGDDDEAIRPQDYTTALNSAVTGNEQNTLIMFGWIQNNLGQINIALGSAATPLNYVSSRLLTESDIITFESWLQASSSLLGNAYQTGVSGIATARNNLQWSENRFTELRTYFDAGYVEVVVEEIDIEEGGSEGGGEEGGEDGGTDGGDNGGVDGGDGDGDTDSANISQISTFALLSTIAVILMNIV